MCSHKTFVEQAMQSVNCIIRMRGLSHVFKCPYSNASSYLQNLTFVAVRLTLSEAQRERLQPQPVTARRLSVSTTTAGKAQNPLSIAPATMRQLQDYISISAQQFQGYIFDVNNEEVCGAFLILPSSCSSASAYSCTCLSCQNQQPSVAFALHQWVHQGALLPHPFCRPGSKQS